MGLAQSPIESVFSGSVTGTVMTVTSMLSGEPIVVGQFVSGTGITAGSRITAFGTGSGGVGTYTLNASSSATGAITIFAAGNSYLGDPSPMSLGVGPLGRVYVWDQICQALVANNIAATQTPAAAGNLTLTAGTSVKSVVRSDGSTVIQLDVPRVVSVTQVTAGTSRNFTVSGYDYYNQPMSELIVSTAGSAVNGKKAFYQISSVSVSGATTTAVTVGTTDIIGIPVRVVDAGYIASVGFGNTLARDAGTFVAADATNPATTTTGDVRGTYVPSAANNGIKRIVMSIAMQGIAVGPQSTRTGALGVTQA
jgi:hypothetical protein